MFSSLAQVPLASCVRTHSRMWVSRFASSTKSTCSYFFHNYRTQVYLDWYRAVPVAVGHADGIHSRTIEILQVRRSSSTTYTFSDASLLRVMV